MSEKLINIFCTAEMQKSATEGGGCRRQLRFNAMGAGVSLLCLVHCLMTPFLAGFISLNHDSAYHLLDYLFLGIALFIILMVSKKSKHWFITLLLWTGILLLLTGLLTGHELSHNSWLVYSGSAMLVIAHGYNFLAGFNKGT